jgi:hypothetical protein
MTEGLIVSEGLKQKIVQVLPPISLILARPAVSVYLRSSVSGLGGSGSAR